MNKVLEFSNGKKTITGVVILVMGLLGICDLIPKEEVANVVSLIVDWVGLTITVIGVIHKLYKRINN